MKNIKLHTTWLVITLAAGGAGYYISYKMNAFKFYEMGWHAADAERALSEKEVARMLKERAAKTK